MQRDKCSLVVQGYGQRMEPTRPPSPPLPPVLSLLLQEILKEILKGHLNPALKKTHSFCLSEADSPLIPLSPAQITLRGASPSISERGRVSLHPPQPSVRH